VQVTLAKPDVGADWHPTPGEQASTVHGSPSSHTEIPPVSHGVVGIVVVVGSSDVVVDDVEG
jgi:hypothetical protein